MGDPATILILCTGNSARSILAEAILNRAGAGRLRAFSAGSQPKDAPNPHALALLADKGYSIKGFRSKSWDEFGGDDAPTMDLILTVCDSAAGESCPYWPGHPMVGHWGIPDPAAVEGGDLEIRAAFELAYERLSARVAALLDTPFETMAPDALKARLADIGALDGATDRARAG